MAAKRHSRDIGCLPCEGACRVCAGPITGRQIFYCSAKCRGVYYRNHQWIWARRAAKIRARQRVGRKVLPGWLCARCGQVTFEPEVNHIVPLNGLRTNVAAATINRTLKCSAASRVTLRRRPHSAPPGSFGAGHCSTSRQSKPRAPDIRGLEF